MRFHHFGIARSIESSRGSGPSIKIMRGFATENRTKTPHDLVTRRSSKIGMGFVNILRTQPIPIMDAATDFAPFGTGREAHDPFPP